MQRYYVVSLISLVKIEIICGCKLYDLDLDDPFLDRSIRRAQCCPTKMSRLIGVKYTK